MRHEITLKDVAARAGVSRTTASNVMSGGGRFSEDTRERVHRAMRELGYVYNRSAASLRTQRTRTVGVMVTHIASPFHAELLVGLEAALTAAGFLSLVATTADDPARQDTLVAELREQRIAALAIVPATGTSPGLLEQLAQARLPHVLMTRYLPGVPAPYVGPDDVLGGRLAAEHLLQHGSRSFAYVGGSAGMVSRHDRRRGIQLGLAAGGMDPVQLQDIPGSSTGPGGLLIGKQLLAGGPLPDAIVCHSDSVAFGVYRALRSSGRAQGIRIIGYDNVHNAALWEPPLTSVATNPITLGRAAAQLILEQIGDDPESVADDSTGSFRVLPDGLSRVFEPQLMVRESCGCAATW
ncbi:MAG: LacI family DNA-binding transcriptional regulator [Micropruina sp.]|uniref:LacI family DNA-binding transcriptional regulator n=1 Tax=Micropruina sp. TaxID=2737536 RepID=UPI0039E2AA00